MRSFGKVGDRRTNTLAMKDRFFRRSPTLNLMLYAILIMFAIAENAIFM
ncbi:MULTISPECIES: hypothetical protein [Kamptonema]|nr:MULTISPECIES: hypothetical protein [Kamptonema]